MSYAPYTPDVQPIPADQYVPPRSRAGRWAIGVVSYFALIAAWLWWMTRTPKIEPPLATVPLPDGTEIRLVGVLRGGNISLQSDATFGNRLPPPNERSARSVTLSGRPGTVWFVFAQFDPVKSAFKDSKMQSFTVLEETPANFQRVAQRARVPEHFRGNVFSLAVTPARTPTLAVTVGYGGQRIQATVPNPLYVARLAELAPQPLPQTAALDGATITLETVLVESSTKTQSSFTQVPGLSAFRENILSYHSVTARPKIRLTCGGLRERDFELAYAFFDATGNEVLGTTTGGRFSAGEALPFSEPAWGLRVRAVQCAFSIPDASAMVSLGEFVVPGAGAVAALPVSPALAAEGITDILLAGKGEYAAAAAAFRLTGRGTSVLPPLKLMNDSAKFNESVNVPSLMIVNRPGRKPANELPFFVARAGEKLDACSLDSTRSGDGFYFRRCSFNPGTAGLVPGTKVALYSVKPKVLQATFHFPPPRPTEAK